MEIQNVDNFATSKPLRFLLRKTIIFQGLGGFNIYWGSGVIVIGGGGQLLIAIPFETVWTLIRLYKMLGLI